MIEIEIKRVYEPSSSDDGYRVLVDRLWPRGVKKSDANIDEWQRDCAPSTDLRNWFAHRPENWTRFKRLYGQELEAHLEEITGFVSRAGNRPITLVYGAKNEQQNQAVVLKRFIQSRVF